MAENDKRTAEDREKARESEWDAIVNAWNDPNVVTEAKAEDSPFEPIDYEFTENDEDVDK